MRKKNVVHQMWGEYVKEYNDFIRDLHLKSINEEVKSKKERAINYAKKLLVIFFASFFTTLTFQFLMNPNGLFNSGINGIIQVLIKYFFAKNRIHKSYFATSYYSCVLLVNIIIVLIVHFFYPKNIEMNSTAIFYVLFQFVWSKIFHYSSLQNYIFNRFAPRGWNDLSNRNQLGLTLPFYITIGVVSSIIHTYGYNLIYRVKSTPGGLEIITSNISQKSKKDKKGKLSIGYIGKIFGFFVIFLITIFNFIFVEGNINLKGNSLMDLINESEDTIKIENRDDLHHYIRTWESSENKRIKSTNIFKEWINDSSIDTNPSNIYYYLMKRSDIFEKLEEEKRNLSFDSEDENQKKIFEINEKIKYFEEKIYEKNLFGYLKYVTNNEKLWASLIYIFLSSYLINQIFPKNKLVNLIAKLKNKENLNKIINILIDYDPIYYKSYSSNDQEIYIVDCSITKWNYQLLLDDLSKLGDISIKIIDE